MSKTLEFDERDLINDVLSRYCKASEKAGLKGSDYTVGEEIIQSFYTSLQQSTSLGNQVRLEKLIGSGRNSLTIRALSSQQRQGFRNFLIKFFWD